MARKLIPYCLVRLVLWLVAVGIALFPTARSVGIHAILDWEFLSHANRDGAFRDILFAIVPAAALSLATTLDFICSGKAASLALPILGVIGGILILVSGFVGFLVIPNDTPLEPDLFVLYSKMIMLGLSVSLVTELWVSVSMEKHRIQLDKERVRLLGVEERYKDLRRTLAKRRT